ncbi:hypothetical protein E2P86_11930 [Sphingobacterium psychroaquaticum]|uniref:hypothetical protein n=1 Tax=Sphingobacterium psychroaquaticum TaxID=561061 RepID=UPI00106A25E8|nr:hypothetical protein [Sphingobacterium psychroaquaticum]QBQ41824.1 hypothetical protein E2P86_11930 [Sphingobacterium psychroaquaticum]
MKVLGIKRKGYFSPNHVGNDAAIFDMVSQELLLKGGHLEVCDEEAFMAREVVEQELIITMGRTKSLVKRLQSLEDQGKIVLNSGYGIENCFRKNMTLKLLAEGVPYPKSLVVDTTTDISDIVAAFGGPGVWIKRGDFHAIHKEDVTFATSVEEAQSILNEYALRGITEAVLSEHLVGDLLKFYAVRGTNFFHWFYPYDHNHHKYTNYESINGETLHYPFNIEDLKRSADQAASVLGVHIYGGDAIVGSDGTFHIIDLNDWPSFAPCRNEASRAIAQFLFDYFTANDAKEETYLHEE